MLARIATLIRSLPPDHHLLTKDRPADVPGAVTMASAE